MSLFALWPRSALSDNATSNLRIRLGEWLSAPSSKRYDI
jgi:hypothetical protein